MNPLFKSRLKEVGINVLTFIIIAAVILAFLAIGLWLPTGILNVLSVLLVVSVGLLVLAAIIILIYQFINWLFIEPFKKEKTR